MNVQIAWWSVTIELPLTLQAGFTVIVCGLLTMAQPVVVAASHCSHELHSAPSFLRPVPGAVTSVFGPRVHPLLRNMQHHAGVDFSASMGQPVRAAETGEVTLVEQSSEFGLALLVHHAEGWETFYGHLMRAEVHTGDCIKRGEIVGLAGSTGLTVEPLLHFEVRRHGVRVDPQEHLAR